MLNKITLIGRLTADPESRYSSNGKAICTFTLAVDRPFKNANGEKETDFIRHIVFGKMAENLAQNLYKGRLVATTGRLQVRTYENQEGKKRSIAEVVAEQVVYLDWPKKEEEIGLPDDTPF